MDNKKGRLIRDDGDDDISDDERVDMSNITGAKEREERREKFYSVQKDCMEILYFDSQNCRQFRINTLRNPKKMVDLTTNSCLLPLLSH